MAQKALSGFLECFLIVCAKCVPTCKPQGPGKGGGPFSFCLIYYPQTAELGN